MAFGHQPSKGGGIRCFELRKAFLRQTVVRHNMPCTTVQRRLKLSNSGFIRNSQITQTRYIQLIACCLALSNAGRIATVRKLMTDTGIDDDKSVSRQARRDDVLKRTGIKEQSSSGITDRRRKLVHDPAGHTDEVVLNRLCSDRYLDWRFRNIKQTGHSVQTRNLQRGRA